MLPPGLATIGLSTKAWLRAEQNKGTPKFYFDLNREKKNQVGQTTTAWTPAITLITGLVESLKMLEEEGYPNVFARHLKLARATQLAGRAIGLNLLATENPSPTITALNIPDGLDGEKVVKTMRDVHGFTVAGGQDHLKGKIVRIGHMGYIDEYDLMATFLALERALVANGWKFPSGKTWGASVSAFVASLQESP
jgi:aspartate aminotransferase-like enzyme